jgi:hypothetical protein
MYEDEENERLARIRAEKGIPTLSFSQLLKKSILLKVEQTVGTDLAVKAKFEVAK